MFLVQISLFDAAGIFKEVRRIEFVVAEELPTIAVKFVGSGFGGGVENRGARTSVLGAEVGGLDFEFLDGVEWRENDKVCAVEEVDGVRVIVDAIEEVVIHRGALTIGGKSAAACVTTGIGLGGVYAYGNLSEKSKIAAVQRKAVHFLGVNDLTDGGILRLQQGGG